MLRVLFLTLLLASCATIQPSSTLYERLGGAKGLEQIVDDFIANIGNDEQVFHYFAKSNVTRFRQGFINHICELAAGPCKYEGDSMVDVHTGMNITESDFNRVVELLVDALEKNNVSYPVQNELLAILAPMRSEIYNM